MVAGGTNNPHHIPGSPPFCGDPLPNDEGRSPTSNERGGGVMPSFMGLVSPFMSCWQPDLNTCVAPSMRTRTGPPPPPQGPPPDIPSPMTSPLVERHNYHQKQKQQQQQQQPASSPQQTTNIRTPHANDVLCGRGGSSNRHVGNTNFRSIVAANKEMYVTLTKKQKMLVARAIVQTIHNQEPPGRFLQKDAESGLWFDIGLPRSLEKTSQALREKNSGEKLAAAAAQERDETGSDVSGAATSLSSTPSSPRSPLDSLPTSPKSPTTPVVNSKSSKNAKPPPITIPPHLEAQFNPRRMMHVRHGPPSPAYDHYGAPPHPHHLQPYPPSPMSEGAYRVGSPPPPHVTPYSQAPRGPPHQHGYTQSMPPHPPGAPPPPPPPPPPRRYSSSSGPPPYPAHSSGAYARSPAGPHPYHTPSHGAAIGGGSVTHHQTSHKPSYPPDVRAHLAYPSFSSGSSPARSSYSSASSSPSRPAYPPSSPPRRSPKVSSPQRGTRRMTKAGIPNEFSPPPPLHSEKSGHTVSPPPRHSISPGRQQVSKKQRTKSRSPLRPSLDDEGKQSSTASLSRDMQDRLSLTEGGKTATTVITPPSSVLQSRSRRQVTKTEQDGLSGLAALAGAALMQLDQGEEKK